MKNFLLLILNFVLSLILAYPFGHLTSHFFPIDFAGYLVSEATNEFANGLFFAYLFITPIVYQLWGTGRKWAVAFIVSLPGLAVAVLVGAGYLTWSVGFFLLGILIAGVIEQFMRPKRVI